MAFNAAQGYGNMQFPATYQNGSYSYNSASNQSYAQPMPQPQQQTIDVMQWVDGDVGAKAFQMPVGWPPNKPIPLWDTNEPIIYLKSINQLGMPNPLQKIHYTMDDVQQPALMSGQSAPRNDEYATKEDIRSIREDFHSLKDDLTAFMNSHGNLSKNDNRSQMNNRNGGQN